MACAFGLVAACGLEFHDRSGSGGEAGVAPTGGATGVGVADGASASVTSGGGSHIGGGTAGAGGCVDTQTDVQNCGACGRGCAATGGAQCIAGECWHVCAAGVIDCLHPAAPAADDGCETTVDDQHCGCGAGTSCDGQCVHHAPSNTYHCTCSPTTPCGAESVCEGLSGDESCKCYPGGAPAEHCTFGETCPNGCSCNGGPDCDPNPTLPDGENEKVCCASGCANLRVDPLNCGACGVICPPNTSCVTGSCG